MVEFEKKGAGDGAEGNEAAKKLAEVTAEKEEILLNYQAVQQELEKQKKITDVGVKLRISIVSQMDCLRFNRNILLQHFFSKAY